MEKRKKRRRWIITFIIVLLAGVGVVILFFNPKKGLKLVLPNLDDITLINATIKNDTAYVGVDMVLENKSIFKLDLDTLFYKIALADSVIFDQTQVLDIRQKPGETNKIELPLKIPITKTMRTIRSLQKQDSTFLDIHAYIVYNTIFGEAKIPVSKKVKIKVPIPPEIKITHVDIDHISLADKTVDLNAHIKIINRGELLDLKIREIRYQIVLGDKLVTSDGVYSDSVVVKPLSTTQLSIPVKVKVNKIVKTAWKYLMNDKVSYRINVTAKLDEKSFYQKTGIPVQTLAEGEAKLRKSDKHNKK